ncbi:hypothetical protein WA158_008260 [Blastocystis sp. Blastoise]
MKRCVITSCGAPASGKSTFFRKLAHEAVCQEENVFVYLISFDNIELQQRNIIESWEITTWRNSRLIALHMLDDILSDPISFSLSIPKECLFLSNCQIPEKIIILVDDTMHLRSMRKSILFFTKKYSCGYGCISFKGDLNTFIKRNETREQKDYVPPSIIQRIYTICEYPQNSPYEWEKYSIEINTDIDSFRYPKEFIDLLFLNPFHKPRELTKEEIESQKKINERACTTFKHLLEIEMRKQVKYFIEQIKNYSNKKEMIQVINQTKKEFQQNKSNYFIEQINKQNIEEDEEINTEQLMHCVIKEYIETCKQEFKSIFNVTLV